jgi:hypothetical protein
MLYLHIRYSVRCPTQTTRGTSSCVSHKFFLRCLPLSLENGNGSSFRNSVLLYLEFQTMDRVQKPSNSECYTPPSEPFRFHCALTCLNLYYRVLHPVCKFTWWWPNIRAETCCEYRGYIIKYFVNCCKKEGITYSFMLEPVGQNWAWEHWQTRLGGEKKSAITTEVWHGTKSNPHLSRRKTPEENCPAGWTEMVTIVSRPSLLNEGAADACEEVPVGDEREIPSAAVPSLATACRSFGEVLEEMLTWKSGGSGACLFPGPEEHDSACLLRSTRRNNKSCRSEAKHPPLSTPSSCRAPKHPSKNCTQHSTLTWKQNYN